MKYIQIIFLTFAIIFSSCSKTGSAAGTPSLPPTNLTVNATVATDNSGNVTFVSSATNAVTYDYDFGNGVYQTVPSGTVTYKYLTSGTYSVNVTAKSADGQTLAKSIQVSVTVTQSLAFDDEFDNPGTPDPNKWGFDIGGNGWGNNELENYTNRLSNAYVSNGTLKITAIKESYGGNAYTSARMVTKDKFAFTYGRIEVKAKLPAGAGTWPAIWMLGSNFATAPWPACGEMDIMEQKGSEPNVIYGTLHHPGHSGGNGDGGRVTISNSSTEFHIYSEEWSPTTIRFLVDGVAYYTFNNSSQLPFNHDFFIILNLAMGGTFGGPVDPAFSSAAMEVDYVRVYK